VTERTSLIAYHKLRLTLIEQKEALKEVERIKAILDKAVEREQKILSELFELVLDEQITFG
jgi:hypothetical protein